MRVYLSTGNAHKAEEFARLFAEAGLDVGVHSASEIGGMPFVDETADDFAGNAKLKAEALREQAPAGSWILADDSGLEVEALGGEPGVRSARYAGPGATDADNRVHLLERLRGLPSKGRARFVCVLVLLGPGGEEEIFKGVCSGRIVADERGTGGFGYDPVFVPEGMEQTFAEVTPEIKDRLSHRGRALRDLVDWMKPRLGSDGTATVDRL